MSPQDKMHEIEHRASRKPLAAIIVAFPIIGVVVLLMFGRADVHALWLVVGMFAFLIVFAMVMKAPQPKPQKAKVDKPWCRWDHPEHH